MCAHKRAFSHSFFPDTPMQELFTREFLLELLLQAPIFIIALTVHEQAHGFVAWTLGDSTAKDAGRLTMNPIRHLDLLGTLAFIFLKVGWARPVPVDLRNFKNPREDMLKVAVAGPAANLFLAVISAILLQVATPFQENLGLAGAILIVMCTASVYINVMLAVFNLLPIPPMDGARILMGVLPPRMAWKYAQFERYGFVLVLILFYTGILSRIIMPLIRYIARLLIG